MSYKIHSKLNNKRNSRSEVQHRLVCGLRGFTNFCGSSAASCAKVLKINQYLCTFTYAHTSYPPYTPEQQNCHKVMKVDKTVSYMSLIKGTDRRRVRIQPGLLTTKSSMHKDSKLSETPRSRKGTRRPAEGRGWVGRTSLPTCPIIILFPPSAREAQGATLRSGPVQTAMHRPICVVTHHQKNQQNWGGSAHLHFFRYCREDGEQ